MAEENDNSVSVQLSVKFGSNGTGYVIVKAPTVAEMIEEGNILMERAGEVNAIVEEVQARSTFANAGITTTAVPQPPFQQDPPAQQYRPQQTQQRQSSGGGAGKPQRTFLGLGSMCAHGVQREIYTGIGKNGKPYTGEYCTVKGDPNMEECKPVYRN